MGDEGWSKGKTFWANGHVCITMMIFQVNTKGKMHQIVRFNYVQLIIGKLPV